MKHLSFIGISTIICISILSSCTKDSVNPQDQNAENITLKAASSLSFSTTDAGVNKSMSYWALGWLDKFPQAINRMGGANQIDVIRISCPKEWKLNSNNSLESEAKADIDSQMTAIKPVIDANPNLKIAIMCSGGNGIHSWFSNGDNIRASRWLELFRATKNYIKSKYGLNLAYIEPSNEQDYGGKVGNKTNINNVMAKFQSDTELGNYPIVGPSTLSCGNANSWYNETKYNTDWGATHAINGGGNSYINFVKKVRNNGKEYFGTEIHNLVEMIIAAEYGGKGGLWWRPVSETEANFSQYCQQGNRICYVEHGDSFSAACGYKATNGNKIYLFAASKNGRSFTFTCNDKKVSFNGGEKQYSYTAKVPKNESVMITATW